MAKQGQHKHDGNDPDVSKGNNNPDKSVTVTTGTPKKQETYQKQAAEHQANNKPAQAAKNEWDEDTSDDASTEAINAKQVGSKERNGSDSNAS